LMTFKTVNFKNHHITYNKEMHDTIHQIINTKLLPLYYNDDYNLCYSNILACCKAGVNVFEFTNRGQYAKEHFKKLKEDLLTICPDLKLGIGTIYSVDQAQSFIDLGADFIVQPVCIQEVAKLCSDASIPWIPGVMTLNEIYQAHLLGAELIKVFPGNVLGTSYIKSVRGPLPEVKLMVTGGVEATTDDVKAWLKAGVNVCGLGSQLFTKSVDEITEILSSIQKEIHE
jgi:2-dehydro-3-deoxyphosphogluconate aldolase / (4S)-4-hydroxy-2-oxoglutarate aldolase